MTKSEKIIELTNHYGAHNNTWIERSNYIGQNWTNHKQQHNGRSSPICIMLNSTSSHICITKKEHSTSNIWRHALQWFLRTSSILVSAKSISKHDTISFASHQPNYSSSTTCTWTKTGSGSCLIHLVDEGGRAGDKLNVVPIEDELILDLLGLQLRQMRQ